MTAKKQETAMPSTPLEKLLNQFSNDMAAVNSIVLNGLGSDVPLIQQLAAYIISSGGKRVRPLLTLASTALYSGDMGRAQNLAACVEFIHTATLLHDDVVDESAQRRGKATANIVFGNQASVLVGDYLFSRAFQMMVHDGSLDVLRILSDASAIIAEGEVMQLMAIGNIETSMETYISVVKAKTAALFAASCEVGPVIAGCDAEQTQALYEYGLNLGIAFQIVDDILDYSAAQAKLGKDIGDDFREGKITAPLIYAIEQANDEERQFWQRVLGDHNQQDCDLKTALEILNKYNALDKAQNLAQTYADKAIQALLPCPESEICTTLKNMVTFTIDREY